NAYLRYFHHYGDHFILRRAIRAYERAIAMNKSDAHPYFNLQFAYGWAGEFDKIEDCCKKARRLAPTWTNVAIAAEKGLVAKLAKETPSEKSVKEQREKFAAASKELELLKAKTFHARSAAQGGTDSLKVSTSIDLPLRDGRIPTQAELTA